MPLRRPTQPVIGCGARVACCGSGEPSSHRCGLRDSSSRCHVLGDCVCMVAWQPARCAIGSCNSGGRSGDIRCLVRGRLHRHTRKAQARLRAPAVEACPDGHVRRICDRARSRMPACKSALNGASWIVGGYFIEPREPSADEEEPGKARRPQRSASERKAIAARRCAGLQARARAVDDRLDARHALAVAFRVRVRAAGGGEALRTH